MVDGTGDKPGRGPGPQALPAPDLDPSWAEVGTGRPIPHQVTAPLSDQLLWHSEEPQEWLVPTLPLTSMKTPEGYFSPGQFQPWSFEAELVLKPSLRRMAPLKAVGGQEQEEEKVEKGIRTTDHQHCEKIWHLGPGWIPSWEDGEGLWEQTRWGGAGTG